MSLIFEKTPRPLFCSKKKPMIIDMHVHTAPDPFNERKCTGVEMARQAAGAGMRGVVLKCHDYMTTPMCSSLNELGLGTELFGSIALNRAVGGLNPRAVLVAARLGTKLVWLPTFDSIPDAARHGDSGIAIIDQDGNLLPEIGHSAMVSCCL